MAHRKHLLPDAHVEPEKNKNTHGKKAHSEQTPKAGNFKREEKPQNKNGIEYGNNHIKDEHGEY